MINKPRVLFTLYNTNNVGGPNVSMLSVANSFLKDFYNFKEIIINDKLGGRLKIHVLRRLIREIKLYNPDIIYVSGLQLHGFYMILASKLAGYKNKTITIVHGSACDSLKIGRIKKIIFQKFLEPYTVRNSYCVYTVCKEMANKSIINKHTKNFGGVIHNAAPDWGQIELKSDLNLREELQIASDSFLFIYTGRVHEEKGLVYLFDAFKNTPRRAHLVIVGDGADFDKFKSYCSSCKELKDRVHFLGKRNDIKELLLDSDVFVFPSLHENLPNSVVEACKLGKAVIATNVGGIPEIITSGIEGILVDPFDSDSLEHAMNDCISNPAIIEKYGARAKLKVDSEFSKEFLYPKIKELFDDIVRRNAK